jgi:hypothetical protein
MPLQHLTLSILSEHFAVCRLEADARIPEWVMQEQHFFSITRTTDELSIVCRQAIVPDGIKVEKDWKALKVEGPLDFSLTGILASLANPLAEAKISIFAISTFDTDYVLIKSDNLERAVEILETFCTIQK